ncbi:unnamed protein product [Clonostachys rosea]|uniref:FAD-binding domain-containing protein n=1 Tax=Bionectria ochroleuca TaxID=29856 RepID=A0ABY6UCK5_BIOOC|nr:unnamed protein product [Clonostachys rosea]
MAAEKEFRVIIVGGGIAGLTLANMLEKFDIDYVVLEAHKEIAPQVGASIGMFPNGLRILDQIGIHDQIKAIFKGEIPYNKSHMRNKHGKLITTIHGFNDQLEHRHGYGLLFFDRQALLQILYDHLQDKSKILTARQFESAELDDWGVTATCADGSTFRGSLLVGADGIHSKARSVMRALGEKLEPGAFDENEESEVPCYYRCSFGIAVDVPGWVSGEQHIVTGDGRSQLVISGPDKRVYWFMFERLPKVRYGDDIPRYTTKDEEEFARRNADVAITERITFGQVFACRLSSALTPLHEIVYKKWFFRRMIILGDSAHKPNPIGGQGGNGAIESCAELVNMLLEKKAARGGTLDKLTTKELEEVLERTQTSRHARAKEIVHAAHRHQRINAYENPLISAIITGYIFPLAGPEQIFTRMSWNLRGATHLKNLPIPKRSRLIPFNDELPALPLSNIISIIVRGGQVASMAALVYISVKTFRFPIPEIAKWAREAPIVIRWFGEGKISEILKILVSVFAIPCSDQDPGIRLQIINFLFQLISPLLIYTIEGNRVGNRGTALRFDLLFASAFQLRGIGQIGPVHTALHALSSHELPTGRHVPVETAKALVPAITLGFVIPTVLMFAPTPNTVAWQHSLALWQFAPPMFVLLTRFTSSMIKKYQRAKGQDNEDKNDMERYANKDLPILKSVYTYAFATQATVHIASMAYAWSHPNISLFKSFLQVPNPFISDWNLPSLGAKLATFFKYDMLLFSASSLATGIYSIWDLRRLGYIKTTDAFTALFGTLVGQFLVGPGATWAGLWYWRENQLASSMARRQ